MIRSVFIFLVAVGLGALTVSGQDEDAAADLKRRIRALTDELRQRSDASLPKIDESARPVMRIYDIGDLVMNYPNSGGDPVDLTPSKFQFPEQAELEEPQSPFEVDWIIEMLRQLVEPAAWDSVEYADVQPRLGRLFVNNIPRVHKKIDAFMKTLRKLADRQLRVQIYAVPVDEKDAALLASATRTLPADAAERLLSRPSMGSTELVCRSNQQLSQRVGRRVGYLGDYDVEIAQEATIGDPISKSAFSGMAVDVRAMLDEGGKGARLDIELSRTHVSEPVRRVDTEHGPLELPELALTRLRTSAWVPLDRVVILGGSTAGTNPCLFLARVTRMGTKTKTK